MSAENKKIVVVDTNVIIDYPDIIPSKDGAVPPPEEPLINLEDAHIVIPSAVTRELSGLKKERSERGKISRMALKRIRNLFEDEKRHTIEESYNLQASVKVGRQTVSILPIHKNFKKALPFSPSETDMDGQIILAALTIEFLMAGLPIDGTARVCDVKSLSSNAVLLLTNDNGLATRAYERGIATSRYGYKYQKPYTGRRDLVVPSKMFNEFLSACCLSREDFERWMPDEPRLVANEFIIMHIAEGEQYPRGYDPYHDPYFSNIGRYDVREDMIVPLKYLRSFPGPIKNPGQAIYAEALADPNIAAVVCTGPAGSGKTFMATVYGYEACREGAYIGVTVVPCENRSNLGALPGDLDEKMDPDVQPLKNALRNYLLKSDSKLKKDLSTFNKFGVNGDKGARVSIRANLQDRVEMIWQNWFVSVPIENARGRDFSHEYAIYDEFQDQNRQQADTLIKRIGTEGKIILTGDIEQIHAAYLDRSNNGLIYASQQLLDDEAVAQVHFIDREVVRHPLVQRIAQKQAKLAAQRRASGMM